MIINYSKVIISIIKKCKNWLQTILAKLLNKKIELITLRNGLRLYIGDKIGKADLSMFHEIWGKEFYNPKGFEINKNDTVFDIGANNGFFSFYASKKASNGLVYAFEPFNKLSTKIKKSIDINGIKNIILINKAVGEKTGKTMLNVSDDHNGCHSLYKRENTNSKIEVDIVNLEDYCVENKIDYINFLKLDCEGAEYEIINENTVSFIKNKIDKISMEFHDNITEYNHKKIVDILKENNFEVKEVNGYIYAKNK